LSESRLAARVLWGTLVGLLVLHVVAGLLPGMWLWGANLPRFLPLPLALLLWGMWGAVLLVAPALHGGPEVRAADAPSGMVRPLLIAIGIAALCWSLPDRTQFTGDFYLREGAVATANASPRELFPQALPLDVWIHYDVPRWLIAKLGLTANFVGRLAGAKEAALWGIFAWVFARGLALPASAMFGVLGAVLFSPVLGLFTGYSKAFTELSLLVLAAGAAAMHVARNGRGLVTLAVVTTLALLIHRSGLTLLPVWLVGCVMWARHWRRPGGQRLLGFWIAGLLPIATLALTLPTMIKAMQVIDATHLMPAEVRRAGFLAATFAPARMRDLGNLVLLVAPLAPLIPVLAVGMGRPVVGKREGVLLGALRLPQLALLLLVHPLQGPFRDWDVFAPAGVSLTLFAAWLAGEALRAPKTAGVALALACAAAAPTIGWLTLLSQPARGVARVEARLVGPPVVDANEAAVGWNYVAFVNFRDQRWDQAANAWQHAVAYAPNPRYFTQWGMAETMRGDHHRAQRLYLRSVELSPDLLLGWLGVAASSSWLGDTAQCRIAASNIRRLDPGNPQLGQIDEYLGRSRARKP